MDSKALLWNSPRPPARLPRPGEPLFAFVRASDQAPMACELRFHGESWGWEAQFFDRGEFLIGRRFDTRNQALQWAELERQAIDDLPTMSGWRRISEQHPERSRAEESTNPHESNGHG